MDADRDQLRRIEEHILRETANVREQVVALDRAGHIVFEKVGGPDEIRLSASEIALLRATAEVITHNHPSGGIGEADYGIAVETNVRELHAFGLRYRYRLARDGATWPGLSEAMPALARRLGATCSRSRRRTLLEGDTLTHGGEARFDAA